MPDPNALSGFGQVDLDLDESAEDSPPESTARAGKVTRRRADDEPIPDEAQGDSATRIYRSEPTSEAPAYTRSAAAGKSIGEQPTRMGSFDEMIAASRSESSASGIATRDDRVAAMREAYARGEADVALELAQVVGADHPDASIVVQVGGEVEVELDVPVHEGTVQLEIKSISEMPAEGVDIVRSALTLTERQSIPRVVLGPAELAKLPIDPRGGFLLSQVDGMQTLEEILDVCAMPAEEALGVFDQLKALGVIEFE